jgi:U3 small nucleolar RNA-associated protein 20
VDHQIHSRGEAIYKELLIQSFNEDVSVDNLDESPVIILLSKTTLLVLHHALRQHFTPIINMLLKEMDKQIKAKKLDEKLISIQLTILSMIVTVRKASRVQGMKDIHLLMSCLGYLHLFDRL